jgi:hypothetical protein
METKENYRSRIFKGAGFLIGLALGAVAGISVAILTGIPGLIGAIAASVAIPSGFLIERKFQREQSGQLAKSQKAYLVLLILGLLLFFVCFFL